LIVFLKHLSTNIPQRCCYLSVKEVQRTEIFMQQWSN
jgi:hypothetical protein